MSLMSERRQRLGGILKEHFYFLTFISCLSTETLDEREDQEDDQRGHADPPESVGGT